MAEEQLIPKMPQLSGEELAHVILASRGPMPHLKLQKLMFYADAWHLVFFDQPLTTEVFEAWVHGPVLRSAWTEFRDVSVLNNDIPDDKIRRDIAEAVIARVTADQREFIEDLLNEYGGHTAYHLERLTHAELPWLQARGELPPFEPSNAQISKDVTREYYASRIK